MPVAICPPYLFSWCFFFFFFYLCLFRLVTAAAHSGLSVTVVHWVLLGMKSSPAASPPRRPEELVNICTPLSDRWATPAKRKLPKEQTGQKCISPPRWRKKKYICRRGSRARDVEHPCPRLFLFIFYLSSSSSSHPSQQMFVEVVLTSTSSPARFHCSVS